MVTDKDVSYESQTYFDVVLKNSSFKGYTSIYVGDGLMVFVHGSKSEIRVNSRKRHQWMKDCWQQFIAQVA